MGKKDFEKPFKSEVFNIADGFVTLNLLSLTYAITRYELISKFGSESIDEQITIKEIRDFRRKEAFDRLIELLQTLVSNTDFAVRDKTKLREIESKLDFIADKGVIERVFISQYDEETKTHIYEIDEQLFTLVLKQIRNIKSLLYQAMNQSSLIFKKMEEFDKDDIIESFIERGM